LFRSRLEGRDRLSWIHKLMARAVAEPGEALRIVMREVIEPRISTWSAWPPRSQACRRPMSGCCAPL
jgi:hypothetical protein